jgi:hypothetical protein
VRVTNLPADTQEALLEQAFAPVERPVKVIINAERHTATIEFEDEAASHLLPLAELRLLLGRLRGEYSYFQRAR